MDIVVKGRKAEVTERFRKHVVEKLSRIERFDGKTMSLDVELSRERNPRQAERCDRIEITMRTRGPVVRAEACAADPYAALDLAAAKLEAQLRRAADRRRIHHGRHSPVSVAIATAALAELEAEEISAQLNGQGKSRHEESHEEKRVHRAGPIEVEGDGPMVVREKTHSAPAMDLCQALYEMELVGHDFYLFVDAESKLPSVVYRRKGYDYGVIHLEENGAAHYADGQAGAEVAAPADARMHAA
ncbi:MAG TPA: ribosome-associated translation inhibitor RaiA [Actinocrinis sp.]|uniref:ribosome hibernation-promoting factor, HPF/YfiA family n=1 Tax=Actinocrinis sp. TaxID=1920516 RepID=UPI002DDD05E5|nr:ribosome-associated translation inhibitor RaiA [Actinocrinis sp.]HEV3169631.1 ribosome-associated translation inhibitor RaiA [Actinocrinis sp.]